MDRDNVRLRARPVVRAYPVGHRALRQPMAFAAKARDLRREISSANVLVCSPSSG
jgi:hypothetical protein